MGELRGKSQRIDPWWTLDPSTGERVRVLPADMVESAQSEATDARVKVMVMQEAAARMRPLARRAITEPGESGDQARRELHEAIAWLARGAPDEEAAECRGKSYRR